MIKIILFFLIVCVTINAQTYKFFHTTNGYNGSITYDGFYKACKQVDNSSNPCTKESLTHGFWNYDLSQSWILQSDISNCLGYSTNSSNIFGPCVVSRWNYATTCTCDMIMQVCCYK